MVPIPLIYSPILIAAKAFRNYNTIKEPLNIVPLEGEILYL